ncbi:MAG TPA: hypothetical protein VGG64_21515 [Pirellulales bacterium]|jgi:4-hydroxybenzoate polyprenyltransferase
MNDKPRKPGDISAKEAVVLVAILLAIMILNAVFLGGTPYFAVVCGLSAAIFVVYYAIKNRGFPPRNK